MPRANMKSTVAKPGPGDTTSVICAVCPHAWDAHDRIGIRYCSATTAGGLQRGCVCVGNIQSETAN